MKIEMELSEEQLTLVINALEIVFRLQMRQESIVSDMLSDFIFPVKPKDANEEETKIWDRKFHEWLTRRDCAKAITKSLIAALYGDYPDKLPKDCHRMSDMWSALRHLQYELLEEKLDYDVRSSEPFQMSDYPMMKINLIEK